MLRILQIANVGQIVGGTAACAWTVTRALPWAEHVVAFLSPISGDTRAAFRPVSLLRWERVTARDVAGIAPDVVLLHNTPRARCDDRLPAVTIQYLHSRITPARAHLACYCSKWLADQYGDPEGRVIHQAVPVPPAHSTPSTATSEMPNTARSPHAGSRSSPLTIGRICTPQARKWPPELPDFYRALATRFPDVAWEFVGAPPSQHAALRRACGDRAAFHNAGWEARVHLHRWHALLYHHPTLTESFGRTCAEAMRAGCIPIVDDRGGFREQVEAADPPPGFLCAGLDDFARAIELLHDPARRQAIAEASRTHGNQRFSLAKFGADLLQILRTVTREKRH